MEKIFRELNRYVLSILLFLSGIAFFVKYVSGDALESQPVGMLIASLALLAVSALAMPVVLEKLDQRFYKSVMAIGVVSAFGLAYANWDSVNSEVEFQRTQKYVQAQTKQRLKDIRSAQEAYLEINGKFANSFDSLEVFLFEEVMPVKFNMGSFHDTLNEEKSIRENYILTREMVAIEAMVIGMTEEELFHLISTDMSPYKVRDTVYTSFFAENFTPEIRAEKRQPFVSVDSLWFSPNSGERFLLETDSVEVGGVVQPTILVQDPTPFGREKVKKDTLRFGSRTEAHTDGNWRD